MVGRVHIGQHLRQRVHIQQLEHLLPLLLGQLLQRGGDVVLMVAGKLLLKGFRRGVAAQDGAQLLGVVGMEQLLLLRLAFVFHVQTSFFESEKELLRQLYLNEGAKKMPLPGRTGSGLSHRGATRDG